LYKGFWLPVLEIEEIRTVPPGDLQHIPKTLRGNQGGFRSLSFRQGIDDDRGSMGKEVDCRGVEVCLLDYLHHGLFVIGRRGVGLGSSDLLFALWGDVQIDQVGEGSPNIGCNS